MGYPSSADAVGIDHDAVVAVAERMGAAGDDLQGLRDRWFADTGRRQDVMGTSAGPAYGAMHARWDAELNILVTALHDLAKRTHDAADRVRRIDGQAAGR